MAHLDGFRLTADSAKTLLLLIQPLILLYRDAVCLLQMGCAQSAIPCVSIRVCFTIGCSTGRCALPAPLPNEGILMPLLAAERATTLDTSNSPAHV